MLVKHVMHDRHQALTRDDLLTDAMAHYIENESNCVPIVDKDHRPVGILTVFRLLKALREGIDSHTPIADVIEETIQSVNENMDFDDVRELPIERLLVLNDDLSLVGVLSKLKLINKVYHSFDKTQRELRVIMESIRNGIIAVDSTQTITHFNSAMQEITGIQAALALGKQLAQVIDDPEILSALDRALPFHHRKIGGAKVLLKTNPIVRDGHNIGAVLTAIDLSEIEKISCELESVKTLNQQLQDILETSSSGILILDEAGKSLFQNVQWNKILPDSDIPSLIAGLPIESGSPAAVKIADHFNRLVSAGQPERTSHVIHGDSARELILTISPITNDDDRTVRFILKLDDMTEVNKLRYESARNHQELQTLRLLQCQEDQLIIKSPSMVRIFKQVERLANVDTTVLINGESGVGKEVVSRQIMRLSSRSEKRFIQINCGAIPEHLFESELFGYEKGSFTGSQRDGKIGLLEAANHGTVLLDEIGEMPMTLQVKMLRVLQENEIYRVGGRSPVKLDIRILAATNCDLEELVRKNRFRKDLFYRLNVVPISIPPLRERREDILPLATLFLERFNKKHNRTTTFSLQTCFCLEAYSWPGNIRELFNTVERLIIMGESNLITPESLPEQMKPPGSIEPLCSPTDPLTPRPLADAVAELEASLVRSAIAQHGSLRPASRVLGISHPTLLRKMRKYKISVQK